MAAQVTDATKALDNEVDAEERSSSPVHLFNSSPRVRSKMVHVGASRRRIVDSDDEDDALSRPTTVASDDEAGQEDGDDALPPIRIDKAQDRPKKLFRSDSEDSDDQQDDDEEEDGLAFLNKFRQRHALESTHLRVDSVAANQRELSGSSLFSGTLSDAPPSSSLSRSIATPLQLSGSNPTQSSSGQTSDVYVTEAQKQADADRKRASREEKVKALAARSAMASATPLDDELPLLSSSGGEDEISSGSDEEMRLTQRRGLAEAVETGRKKGTRQRHALLSDVSDDDSILSDMDMEGVLQNTSAAPKPLSKKEQDKMQQVQARIEREKRVSLARTVNAEKRERKHFGIHDLIANIGASESSKRGLKLSHSAVPRLDRGYSSSSDPIESSSDGEPATQSKPSSSPKPLLSRRPLPLRIREKFPAGSMEALNDTSTDDSIAGDKDDKFKLWQQQKAAALREAMANDIKVKQARVSVAPTIVDVDNSVELLDAAAPSNKDATKSPHYAAPSRTDKMSKQLGLPKTPGSAKRKAHRAAALHRQSGSPPIQVASDDDDSSMDEDEVTASQVQRAGRAFGQAIGLADESQQKIMGVDKQDKSAPAGKDKKPAKSPKSRNANAARLTRKDLDSYIVKQMEKQNIKLRETKQAAAGIRPQSHQIEQDAGENDVQQLLLRLEENARKRAPFGAGADAEQDDEGDDSEYDPDRADSDQESAIDLGSGNEEEDENDNEAAPQVDDEAEADSEVESQRVQGPSFAQSESPPASPIVVHANKNRRAARTVLDDDDDDQDGDDTVVPVLPHSIHVTTLSSSPRQASDAKTSPVLGLAAPGAVDLSEFFSATPEPNDGGVGVAADRSDSDSAFGRFFQDTQPDGILRGESFPVLPPTGAPIGFTQLFEQGSPLLSAPADRSLMPPPSTSAKGLSLIHGSDHDGFAALRKAQASAALHVDDEPADLPALDDVFRPEQEEENLALELEAMRAEEEERLARLAKQRAENNVMYINKEGFFTQTRPESYSFNMSQGLTQSQGLEDGRLQKGTSSVQSSGRSTDDRLPVEQIEDVDDAPRRRRFRRAISSDGEEDAGPQLRTSPDEGGVSGSDAESVDINARKKQSSPSKDASSSPRHLVRTAFDVMKDAAAKSKKATLPTRDRKAERAERNQFVQGEAEESDGDSDEAPGQAKRRRGGHGGLQGVFSDEEGGKSDDGDHEDDSEDDDADLEGLIDEERDVDEAEKDALARERYFKDRDEDEQAALALHERATRGAFRNKRRSRNQDGTLEGFLDEDFEDDWLEKKAKNPYGLVAKKRRLEGKDGMDLLAEQEESQAFVREYHDSHQTSYELDAYKFLLPIENDDMDDEDAMNDEEARQMLGDLHESGVRGAGERDDDDDDNADSDDEEQPVSKTISRKEIQQAIALRRRARRRRQQAAALLGSDDEAEQEEERRQQEEEQRRERELQRNIEKALYNASDDDDDEFRVEMQVDNRSLNRIDVTRSRRRADGDEDDDAALPFNVPGLASSHKSISSREKERLARLAKEYENEPEWRSAKGAMQRPRGAPSRGSSTSSGASRTTPAASLKDSAAPRPKVNSRLRGVLSRSKHFTNPA